MAEKINIDGLSIAELKALSERIGATIIQRQEETKTALIEEFRRRADEAGLSFDSLMRPAPRGPSKGSSSTAGKKVAVKFRGPKGEEWSGRGRTPTWLTEAESKGKKRESFLVQMDH